MSGLGAGLGWREEERIRFPEVKRILSKKARALWKDTSY